MKDMTRMLAIEGMAKYAQTMMPRDMIPAGLNDKLSRHSNWARPAEEPPMKPAAIPPPRTKFTTMQDGSMYNQYGARAFNGNNPMGFTRDQAKRFETLRRLRNSNPELKYTPVMQRLGREVKEMGNNKSPVNPGIFSRLGQLGSMIMGR